MTSRDPKRSRSCPSSQVYLDANISKTVRDGPDGGSVLMDHQYEMAYGESNGHVIESQDGGLAEVCTLWVFCLIYTKIGHPTAGLHQTLRYITLWNLVLKIPHISQGSVAKYFRCGGCFISALFTLMNVPVKTFWKLVTVWCSSDEDLAVYFFGPLCIFCRRYIQTSTKRVTGI